MATPPRIVLPGRTVHLIINAANQQFRFVPTPDVVASIQYIFWYCVEKYGVSVHANCWMSNHAHCVLTDELGVLPSFVNNMNSLLSRQLNALRKSKGGNIEKRYSDAEILDDARVVETCAYVLANPCAANLVAKAKSWRGVTSARLEFGEWFEFKRPACGLWAEDNSQDDAAPRRRSTSKLPEIVRGRLTRPNIFPELSDQELRDKILQETASLEKQAAAERKAEKKGLVPWMKVQARQPNDLPRELRTGPSSVPRVSTNCQQLRALAWRKIRAFLDQYTSALHHFVNKDYNKAVFPPGTWKMRRRFNVTCDTSLAPPALA